MIDQLQQDEQLVRKQIAELLAQLPARTTKPSEFLGKQFDLGLAWVHFPVGCGGLDVSPKFQKIVNEEIGKAGGPSATLEIRLDTDCAAPQLWSGEVLFRRRAISDHCSRVKRSGVSYFRNLVRVRTLQVCRQKVFVMETNGW